MVCFADFFHMLMQFNWIPVDYFTFLLEGFIEVVFLFTWFLNFLIIQLGLCLFCLVLYLSWILHIVPPGASCFFCTVVVAEQII